MIRFSELHTFIRAACATVLCLGALAAAPPAAAYHYFEPAKGGCRWTAVGPGNVDFAVDVSSTADIGNALLAEVIAGRDRWNGIATARDVLGTFALSTVDFDETNFGTAWGKGTNSGTSDGKNEVVSDETGKIFELLGLDAASVNGYGPSRRDVSGSTCTITDAFNLLNSTRANFDRASTTVHEFGHIQGLAHSSVGEFNSNNSTAFNGGYGSPSSSLRPVNIASVPTMHPFSSGTGTNRQTPEADDIAGLSQLYPEASFAASFGSIAGTVKRCSDDKPASGINVRAINAADSAIQVSRYTGFDGNGNGRFEIKGLPPGSYEVVVEEMGHNGFTVGKMAIATGLDQGFPFEFYGPSVEQENACSEDQADAPLPTSVAAGGSSDIAINLNDGVRLAFVVDDTGSMSDEISAVVQILNLLIDNLAGRSEPFPRTAIVSFKDNVTRRIVSADPVPLRASVNGLSAGGGGDCPESSNAAVLDAGRILARGGKAVLFTDADSRPDGPARSSVLEYYRGRSLALSVLLSATCSEEFPAKAGPGVPGSKRSLRRGQTDGISGLEPDFMDLRSGRWLARLLPGSGGAAADEFADPPTLGFEDALTTNSSLAEATGGVFVATPRPSSGDRRTRYINTGLNISLGSVISAVAATAPQSAPQGATLGIDIKGTNTNWTSDSLVSFPDTSITVVSKQTLAPNLIRARITVAAAQALGFFDLKVETALGSGTETATGVGALQVTAPVGGGEITSVSPASALRGQTVDLSIFGLGTSFAATSVVEFRRHGSIDPAVTINSVDVVSPTELRANVSVAAAADPGLLDINVDALVRPRGFVIAEPPPVVPRVATVTPALGSVGASGLDVTVVGSDTHFADGSTVQFSGSGITVTGVTVVSATQLVATIDIADDAAPGFRDVIVNSADETAASLSAFQVVLPPPEITSVTPIQGRAGTTGLALTIAGVRTAFDDSTTVAFSGGGITVTSVNAVSPTELQVVVDIARAAALGARDVTTTTGAVVVSAAGAFTVFSPPPAILSVSPAQARAATRGLDVTIRAEYAEFGAGTTVRFSGDGITLKSVRVVDEDELVATIDIATLATHGARDITVSTGSLVATRTGAFTVTAPQPIAADGGGGLDWGVLVGLLVLARLRRRSARR